MDILVNLLIALHLFSLVLGMGSGIALTVVMKRVGAARDEERARLFALGSTFSRNGHIGLGLLWITGIVVAFLKYGGLGGFGAWFWIKMALVIVLSASIGMGSAAYRKFRNGETAASGRMAMFSTLSAAAGMLTIVAAVFAFA